MFASRRLSSTCLRRTSMMRSMCWIETGHASMQARQVVQDQLDIAEIGSSMGVGQPAEPLLPTPSRRETKLLR